MAEIALNTTMSVSQEKVAAVKRSGAGDVRFRILSFSAAALVVLIFLGMMAALADGAWPAIKAFGWSFVTSEKWNPVSEEFGALASIYGTLISSFLAMGLAVPVGIGIAIFLTEICPLPLRRPIGIAIELLAGIPSIVYGIWGLFTFAPFFQEHVQPWIVDAVVDIPILQDIFAGPPYGIGIFTASFILSIMIIPFISAVTRDVFETVPGHLKESAYAMGCTTWEVVWHVVLPFSRAGVVGGAMLALGRALGETMAVTFVIGNSHRIHSSIFAPGTTISATVANEFTEAVGDVYKSSLVEAGLILFFISFVVLASAQIMLRILHKRAGGISG
ncbi:phosphate transport system permease protein [Rhizomicrobium palustre]|uniref:Phosphate transport system permease protein n=1 Tax=Rhizomicrobium palustre TaxID=189966 RepID=A0A846MYP5_9PROT|nr:phosphate ABC transporter permease subunit PstC [Rhizomicrobium palustre]NIK88152.1 phosphate transport system permease protein [Rhizomicrobium palustre]